MKYSIERRSSVGSEWQEACGLSVNLKMRYKEQQVELSTPLQRVAQVLQAAQGTPIESNRKQVNAQHHRRALTTYITPHLITQEQVVREKIDPKAQKNNIMFKNELLTNVIQAQPQGAIATPEYYRGNALSARKIKYFPALLQQRKTRLEAAKRMQNTSNNDIDNRQIIQKTMLQHNYLGIRQKSVIENTSFKNWFNQQQWLEPPKSANQQAFQQYRHTFYEFNGDLKQGDLQQKQGKNKQFTNFSTIDFEQLLISTKQSPQKEKQNQQQEMQNTLLSLYTKFCDEKRKEKTGGASVLIVAPKKEKQQSNSMQKYNCGTLTDLSKSFLTESGESRSASAAITTPRSLLLQLEHLQQQQVTLSPKKIVSKPSFSTEDEDQERAISNDLADDELSTPSTIKQTMVKIKPSSPYRPSPNHRRIVVRARAQNTVI